MRYDLVLNHEQSANLVKTEGMGAFVASVQAKYPDYKFYSCSLDWVNDRKYICKLKGRNGDVIIGWEENMKTQTVKFSVKEEVVKEISVPVSREMEVRENNQLLISQTQNDIKSEYNTDQVKITFVMTERDKR